MTAHSFAAPPAPYTIDFAPQVDDLHRRLDAARWPEQDVVPDDVDYGEHGAFGLGAGPSLALMKELAQEWRGQDQKQLQDHLNSYVSTTGARSFIGPLGFARLIRYSSPSYKNYRVEIEGLDIHFLHYPSSRAGAFPLILCHGWPGGYHEFLHVLERLTEPKDQGSRAFHVVVPSMPGYAFSSPPKTAKWGMEDTARVFDKLMTGLGYVRCAFSRAVTVCTA